MGSTLEKSSNPHLTSGEKPIKPEDILNTHRPYMVPNIKIDGLA